VVKKIMQFVLLFHMDLVDCFLIYWYAVCVFVAVLMVMYNLEHVC
jgi:hypothetical protein